ncbi:porin PorA family protein [Nocardia sp. NPDC050793]|uniref:porin PorA family protein n=1 Tax=Nocardia sp. NPDC050793 TaxID=3155159 RepID=UPI003400EFAA
MALSAGTRRTVACLLVGLGALLIVMALLIPTYTVDKLAKTPLDLEITTIANSQQGSESLVLDSRSLTSPEGAAKVDTNVPLISQRFVTVEEPSDATEMTIQAGQTLRRIDKQGDTGLLTALVDRVTIDRKTGMPVDKDPNGSIAVSANPQGESIADPVHRTGLQYRFPIGTEKKSYPYFDVNARKTFDIDFVEETEINSLKVYHFRQSIPVTNLWDVVQAPTNRLSLPAAKWGLEGEEPVTMTRFYTNTRDLWVEPQTGTVIKGGEQLHLYYARSGDKPDVTALKSNIIFDENTIESQMSVAQDNIDRLSLYGRIMPIVLGVLGVILAIVGVILGIRGGSTPAPARPMRGGNLPPSGAATPPRGSAQRGADDAPTEQINVKKNL